MAAYAASGDLEAVAEMLRADKEHGRHDDDDFVMPPEKERKRLVLVISCVGLTMTFLAAVMVGITLGFSQTLDEKVSSKQKLFPNFLLFLMSLPMKTWIYYRRRNLKSVFFSLIIQGCHILSYKERILSKVLPKVARELNSISNLNFRK